MVANVRHLTSGFVSPQFHIVFDDRFHTVHGSGTDDMITDTICDLLWENDREIYAEDEFGPDGSLIYTPPPLDKVWLDEEGLRERRTRLLEQRHRVERRIRQQTQAVPTPTEPDDSISHRHPIISDDSLAAVDDDPVVGPDDENASSADSPLIFEPEGDNWADHDFGNGGMISDDSEVGNTLPSPESPAPRGASTPSSKSTSSSSSKSNTTPSSRSTAGSQKKVNWKDAVIDKPIYS